MKPRIKFIQGFIKQNATHLTSNFSFVHTVNIFYKLFWTIFLPTNKILLLFFHSTQNHIFKCPIKFFNKCNSFIELSRISFFDNSTLLSQILLFYLEYKKNPQTLMFTVIRKYRNLLIINADKQYLLTKARLWIKNSLAFA